MKLNMLSNHEFDIKELVVINCHANTITIDGKIYERAPTFDIKGGFGHPKELTFEVVSNKDYSISYNHCYFRRLNII